MSNFSKWHVAKSVDPERHAYLEGLRFAKQAIINNGQEGALPVVDRELDEVICEAEAADQ
jgi:hypothetical protein